MQEAEGTDLREPEVTLNYNQYYPTLLPLRQPGMEETDTEAHARDDRPPDLSLAKVLSCQQLRTQITALSLYQNWAASTKLLLPLSGVTQGSFVNHTSAIDHVPMQDDSGSAAEELGLLEIDPDSERLMLFQLPSLLPVHASASTQAGTPVQSLAQPTASSLDQLPSGKVGVSHQCNHCLECRVCLLQGVPAALTCSAYEHTKCFSYQNINQSIYLMSWGATGSNRQEYACGSMSSSDMWENSLSAQVCSASSHHSLQVYSVTRCSQVVTCCLCVSCCATA